MPHNKSKTDAGDRNKVAGGEDYEVAYLAEQTGISMQQARDLIKQIGNNRDDPMEAAAKNLEQGQ